MTVEQLIEILQTYMPHYTVVICNYANDEETEFHIDTQGAELRITVDLVDDRPDYEREGEIME